MDSWVIFILGLVLGIPLSIFANIATPWVKSYFKKRNLTARERKIYIIVSRYHSIKNMRENHFLFYARAIGLLAVGSSALAFLIFLSSLLIYLESKPNDLWDFGLSLALFIFLSIALYFFGFVADMATDITMFDKYEKDVIQQIKKLKGSPDDLDKAET